LEVKGKRSLDRKGSGAGMAANMVAKGAHGD
jgi:hypothetical protein